MSLEIYYGIIIFIMGICIGSFLNVCVYRIPKGESIVNPPSHCTNCNNKIKWYDLIPIFSWIFLRGRCRHCKEKISPRYILVELFTGVIFVLIFLKFRFSIETIKYIVLSIFLVVIGLIDFDTTDVYDMHIILASIFGFIFLGIGYFTNHNIMPYIYGVLLGGGLISLIILLTGGMGWGDAEICALCGLYLGLSNTVVTLFFSFIIGGVFGALLLISKKKGGKDAIPFGPFIAIATFIAMLCGDNIVSWYINKFF